MSDYSPAELLPVAAGLAERYTSKESSSVSYEKARQLMDAVLYCIHECEEGNTLTGGKRLTAEEAYQHGYEKALQKVCRTKEEYHELISTFQAFGNENYRDTVTKGIAGFFLYYDVRFAPQETIITMDYPVLCPVSGCTGIDAVEKYVAYLVLEQKFLGALPEEYVFEVLFRFQKDYRKQFYNICAILLRHVLSCMLIGKKIGISESDLEYARLRERILRQEKEELRQTIAELLWRLIEGRYGGDILLFEYLKQDITDFVSCLRLGAELGTLQRIVVL